MLLSEGEGKAYNPNEIDIEGHSPLSLYLRGTNASGLFFSQTLYMDNIFATLVGHGANVNIVYPEIIYKPAFTEEDVEDESYDPKAIYKCTPLINVIRQNAKFKDVMRENVMGLI
jgi:hypothetical protein